MARGGVSTLRSARRVTTIVRERPAACKTMRPDLSFPSSHAATTVYRKLAPSLPRTKAPLTPIPCRSSAKMSDALSQNLDLGQTVTSYLPGPNTFVKPARTRTR